MQMMMMMNINMMMKMIMMMIMMIMMMMTMMLMNRTMMININMMMKMILMMIIDHDDDDDDDGNDDYDDDDDNDGECYNKDTCIGVNNDVDLKLLRQPDILPDHLLEPRDSIIPQDKPDKRKKVRKTKTRDAIIVIFMNNRED